MQLNPTAVLIVAGSLAAGLVTQPAPRSGIDLTSLDRSLRPQDDLYRFANGGWLDRTAIPADAVTFSAATELVLKVDADLRALIEDIAARPGRRRGSPEQQIADLYASMIDVESIEARGLTPLVAELQRIHALDSGRAFAAEAGRLTSLGVAGAFGTVLATDPADPGSLTVRLTQGGTMLPDRSYYLAADAGSALVRRGYEGYLTTIFRLTGRPDPAADAADVLALETEIARAQLPQDEARDAAASPRRFTLAELAAAMPGFDWMAWARPQNIQQAPAVLVAHPPFFERFAALVATGPIDRWRLWLAARYLTASAPYVSRPLSDARFEFFGERLTGQPAPRDRWRRGVALVGAHLGDALGRRYVERHFPRSAKNQAEAIVANLIRAAREAIDGAQWMAPQTRREARRKLDRLSTRIGFPSTWRDYRGLDIRPDDLVGNIERARRFENDYRVRWLGQPSAGDGWLMPPQTVNAYYGPGAHEIVFPAAILQPPYFDPAADAAVNYGAIGSVIGHEISHAFTGAGRELDGDGRRRDWWTPADDRAYEALAQGLIGQFDGYRPGEGLAVNGRLTVGENLGDLAGLAISFRAYRSSLGGRVAPVIDGFTGDQRFFIGWAQISRSKIRGEHLRQWLLTTTHAPGEFRANGPVIHLDAFQEAFGTRPGDALYLDPARRIRIW